MLLPNAKPWRVNRRNVDWRRWNDRRWNARLGWWRRTATRQPEGAGRGSATDVAIILDWSAPHAGVNVRELRRRLSYGRNRSAVGESPYRFTDLSYPRDGAEDAAASTGRALRCAALAPALRGGGSQSRDDPVINRIVLGFNRACAGRSSARDVGGAWHLRRARLLLLRGSSRRPSTTRWVGPLRKSRQP